MRALFCIIFALMCGAVSALTAQLAFQVADGIVLVNEFDHSLSSLTGLDSVQFMTLVLGILAGGYFMLAIGLLCIARPSEQKAR